MRLGGNAEKRIDVDAARPWIRLQMGVPLTNALATGAKFSLCAIEFLLYELDVAREERLASLCGGSRSCRSNRDGATLFINEADQDSPCFGVR